MQSPSLEQGALVLAAAAALIPANVQQASAVLE